MNLKENIQPIACLQSNAADIARRVNTVREPMMITVTAWCKWRFRINTRISSKSIPLHC